VVVLVSDGEVTVEKVAVVVANVVVELSVKVGVTELVPVVVDMLEVKELTVPVEIVEESDEVKEVGVNVLEDVAEVLVEEAEILVNVVVAHS
jgi:hypothetical protein